MKATGIVRRIDELGRVVIPKEIRRTLRIREGDPLEIFTDREGEVILKKYSPIGELGDFAKEYAESLQLALGMTPPSVLTAFVYIIVPSSSSTTVSRLLAISSKYLPNASSIAFARFIGIAAVILA